MESHHTEQEETLIEVTTGMNAVAVSHQSRPQPRERRSYFKCSVILATILALTIGLLAGLMVVLFIFAMSCNLEGPPPPITTNVKQLPRSYSKGTYDIFTANKSADYFIYGWLRLSDPPGNDITLFQTFGGQQRILSTQKANKKEISFFHKIKLAKGGKIGITLQLPYTDSLFHMYEL